MRRSRVALHFSQKNEEAIGRAESRSGSWKRVFSEKKRERKREKEIAGILPRIISWKLREG